MEFKVTGGIHLPDGDLVIDSTRARPHAVISHGHSDHVGRHAAADATAPTAELVRDRFSGRIRVTAREFGAPFQHGNLQVTLFPAGHVLGSAQVLVDDGRCRLLYSGDLRLRGSPVAETVEVPRADVVIVDATFGRRRYRFPPDAVVVEAIVRFCHDCFAAGETPVLLAYALGKAQEIIAYLGQHGLPVVAHPDVMRINAIYGRQGLALPQCSELADAVPTGSVVVAPPGAMRGGALRGRGRLRTAILTGWAIDSGARYRYHADAAFPLSDHCGFDDILRYVELCGAREVHPVFGHADELVRELQLRGICAALPGKAFQPALPGFV